MLRLRNVLVVLVFLFAGCALAQNTITFSGMVTDHTQDLMDMERPCCGCEGGIVMDSIGPDRKPVYRGGFEGIGNPYGWPARGQFLPNQRLTERCRPPSDAPGSGTGQTDHLTTGQATFDDWFRPSPKYSIPIPMQLVLNETTPGSGTYQFNRAAPQTFFPIDGFGWGDDDQYAPLTQNFYFCFEIHAEFIYAGNEVFSFSGDDDVWVFVNGKLVVDIGGVHGAEFSTVNLTDVAGAVGLVLGQRHSFDFFQCERHLTGSNSLITTSIVPTNQPPIAASKVYEVAQGASVSDSFPVFDPDGDATIVVVVSSPAAPTFTATGSTFVFVAPSDGAAATFTVVYTARDAELTSCSGTLTFNVAASQFAPPPPPVAAPAPKKVILSKEATIAIAVVGSVLVIAAIAGIIAVIIYTRSKMATWESEIHDALTKEGLLQNPLYEGNSQENFNPMYEQ